MSSRPLEPLERLALAFSRLPGIGSKTAHRLAYHVLDWNPEDVQSFADALVDAKEKIHFCSQCGHYTTEYLCGICEDPQRSSEILCVVRDPRDVIAMEKNHHYKGRYHVLHGVLSPMDGIGVDDIRIAELLSRIEKEGVSEIVLATNPDVEGEATASYLARALESYPVLVTRIAHGIPIGGNLEYTDELTLQRAFDGRREM